MPPFRHTAPLLRACCLTLLLLAGWLGKVRPAPAAAGSRVITATESRAGRPELSSPEWLPQEALPSSPEAASGAPGLPPLPAWLDTDAPYAPLVAWCTRLPRQTGAPPGRLYRQLLQTAISPNAP